MSIIRKNYTTHYVCDHPTCDRIGYDRDFSGRMYFKDRWGFSSIDEGGEFMTVNHYCWEHTEYGKNENPAAKWVFSP